MTPSPLHKQSPKDGLFDFSLLRILVDSLPDHAYVKDAQGRYVLNNLGHAEALGAASPEEVAGKTAFDFFPRELAEQCLADEQEIIRSGQPLVDKEEATVDEEGNERWHSTTKVPLRDGSGKVIGLVGMSRDITDRKEAEEKLRESEARLAEAQRVAHLGNWEGDAKTGEVYWSDEVFRIYGYEREFVPALDKLVELAHPNDRNLLRKHIDAALHEGEPYDFEHRVVRRDGKERIVHCQAEIVFDEEDEPLRIIGTIHDITERKEAEEALKESEGRYRAVMEQSAEAIWLFDADTKEVLESNTAFQELLGYTAEELRGMTNYDFVAHSDEEVDAAVDRKVEKGRTTPAERKYRRKDGTLLDVEVNGTLISYAGKEVVCSVARDLTERKVAEEALRASEERFRKVFEDAPIGVCLVGLDRRHLRVNRAFCEMVGYSEEELLDKPHPEIVHPDDREESSRRLQRALEGGPRSYTLERRYVHADGHAVWNLSSVSVITDSEGEPSHLVCLHQDITERKALEERLEHQAFYDSLTDLPNRALFLDRLGHSLTRADREGGIVAVLFVDLDDFKLINDSMGHDAGNEVLVQTAERLKSCVRSGDTVGRIFGDEFVVLLETPTDVEEACRVAERIHEAFQVPFDIDGHKVFVSPSVGIALGESEEDQAKEVVRHADLAMYEAKKDGNAKYEVYDRSLNTRAVERMELEEGLRRAVEREELEIHYQPKVLLKTGEIVGIEALVRWQHPARGLLMPEEFIPLAEETGLIGQIGPWVLRESCRQFKEWQKRYTAKLGSSFDLCVNLSAREIRQPNLAEKIARVLRETGLDPQRLVLELSERMAIKDAEQTIGRLRELKDLGVGLALDDFGTGYCSLVYLEHSLLDLLKIDRMLVHRKKEDWEECVTIISALTSMAHSLGLAVLVEGVEDEDQLAELKEMGCDMAQGQYFAKPLPSEAVEKLLAEGGSWLKRSERG